MGDEARRLQSKHPGDADQIAAKQAEIVGLWEGLKRKAAKRGTRLEDAQRFQKFLGDYRWADVVDYVMAIVLYGRAMGVTM